MKEVVTAAPGARITDRDAAEVRVELKRIETERGLVTADAVVDAARPAGAPLHRFFEWDDSEAAEQWRCQQARVLIRAIVVTTETIAYPAFVNLPRRIIAEVAPAEEGSHLNPYLSTDLVMANEEQAKAVMEQARRDLLAFRRRYGQLAAVHEEFRETYQPVLDVIEKVTAAPAG